MLHVESYLKEKELEWSPKTIRSTRFTLTKLLPYLTGDPVILWDYLLANQEPYSRVTSWGRVCGFWEWANPGKNPYREFRVKNARLFRGKYVRKTTSETMKEARTKIESISDPAIKRKALELLLTGMRWSESFTLKNGIIEGKGGAQRAIDLPKVDGPELTCHYFTFLRALRDVGLKPHSLRKIYLSECVASGANVYELKELAGWASLESSLSYINVNAKRLKEIRQTVRKKSQ